MRGSSFLIERCAESPSFTPEDFSESDRAIAKTTRMFSSREVHPVSAKIESQEPGLMRRLLRNAGDMGLLMAEVPEEHGGLGLGHVAAAIIAENTTHQGSYVVAHVCHTGIGMLPVLCYGTPEQKARYLPRLANGETIGAYALTESEAGTDARAVRTVARLSSSGSHFELNGEKAFCTNGGIADIFTIFAKVEGSDGLSAFLVERGTPGFSVGREEAKMGILGSSTTPLVFDGARVPAANLLGKVGSGHRIAYNVLNAGRLRLAAACVGQMKRLMEECVPYARQRVQFGRPIAEFELVRHKIARAAIDLYLLESLVYRASGVIDEAISAGRLKQDEALSEFAIESSIAKVFGSEALFRAADDAVQLFGGYGFMRDYPVEQRFRDCRINRIFEGTNEIIRLTITNELMKGLSRVALPQGALRQGPFAHLALRAESLKRLAVHVAAVAAEKLGDQLKARQGVAATVADLAIAAYAFDSGVARAIKAAERGEGELSKRYAMTCEAWAADRIPHLAVDAMQALAVVAGSDNSLYEMHRDAVACMVPSQAVDVGQLYDAIAGQYY
ncbi:MAG: acyl-CoA dehydrogenase family protein [bacterium]